MGDPPTEQDVAVRQLSSSLLSLASSSCDPLSWTPGLVMRVEDAGQTFGLILQAALQDAGAQLNALNPITRLPDEMLCRIFEFAGRPGVVSAVCRRWRAAAVPHVRLWTDIYVQRRHSEYGDLTLRRLCWRLSRTGLVPVDVRYHCGVALLSDDLHLDPLVDHMCHVRSLDLEVHERYLQDYWRVGLTMPAPRLESLSLATAVLNGPKDVDFFPVDLFSGCAPILSHLTVRGLLLPPVDWLPLRGLRSLVYKGESTDGHDVLKLVQTAIQLEDVTIDVRLFSIDESWNPVVDAGSRMFSSVKLILRDGTDEELQQLLRITGLGVSRTLTVHLQTDANAIEWFTTADFAAESLTIHSAKVRPLRSSPLVAAARDGQGRTRYLRLSSSLSGRLASFSPCFADLATLSISEEYWPRSRSNAHLELPKLRELSVLLFDPVYAVHVYDYDGIFCMTLRPGRAWYLPALRSLHFCYACWALKTPDHPRYLTVSAHDIATFFAWNVRSDERVSLVLNNILLHEPPDHPEVLGLDQLVDGWTVVGDYNPVPLDDDDATRTLP